MAIANGADLKAVVIATLPQGGQHINVIYWEADFEEEQSDSVVVEDLSGQLNNMFDDLEGIQHEDMVYDQYVFYRRVLTEWEWFGEGIPDVTPANIGTALPSGVAAVMRMYTTRNKTIGRKFIGGLTEEGWNGTSWSASEITALGLFMAKWEADYLAEAGINYKAGVFSEVYGFRASTETAVLNTIPGYQRRRKPGVGA